MNWSWNSLRIPLRSCLARTSPNSALYKSIWHVRSNSSYALKAQSTDVWASSYCIWYTLSSSLLHFLPRFIRATWQYTLNLHSQPKSSLPMPCSHAHRTNGSHTRTSNAHAFACWMKMWLTSSRYQTCPLSPGGIQGCPSELCSTNLKAPTANRTPWRCLQTTHCSEVHSTP
jgi:hypothetical protein